ncbi:hypothetical protein EYZ11_010163 [Aspergillus tanneri]|uniref:Uncharacterized protein n=1 Tax=Aspergillus tanneri TaxID=1220188 RepID=A0A4S3J6J9_9EURO|nr:hypothetical protein EYZ11_010163 [Aspergillus tanneri]
MADFGCASTGAKMRNFNEKPSDLKSYQ